MGLLDEMFVSNAQLQYEAEEDIQACINDWIFNQDETGFISPIALTLPIQLELDLDEDVPF